ncbi:MAG: ClpXP protease specificity-enhancing factor SspB [Deltaproteobacteria bacterium]
MPPLPPKKAVALDLLERTSVFVHLDPRRPGVIVPLVFAKQPNLVLQLGLNMAISIPDLEVGDSGLSCTLSFNRRPHFCRLPWSAIYALIGQEGGGMVWPEDVPPEVVAQQRSAAKKDAPARKPALRAVEGGAVEGGAVQGGDSADRHGVGVRAAAPDEAEEEAPPAQRSPAPLKGEPTRKQNLRRTSSVPPRLVQQHSPRFDRDASDRDAADRDAQLEPAAELEARESSPAPPATTPPPELATRPGRNSADSDSADGDSADSDSADSEAAVADSAATGSSGKRARPPYLRLVR